jgi:hypothetical protein
MIVPGGPAASPACCAPQYQTHNTFVPAAGDAAGPTIDPALIIRFVRSRDDRTSRAGGLAGLSEHAIHEHDTFGPADERTPYRFNPKKLFNTDPRSVSVDE